MGIGAGDQDVKDEVCVAPILPGQELHGGQVIVAAPPKVFVTAEDGAQRGVNGSPRAIGSTATTQAHQLAGVVEEE